MTQWYVKDLSRITGVSVQTLHHYDRIDLLKPSVRLSNGYRLYSEADLLKLQQIIALKFFGFELSQIKFLLAGKVDIADHFSVQAQFLEEKAKTLFEAGQTLKRIVSDCCDDKSIPWKTIIKLIEVYSMTQQLEKTWAGKVLSPEELKQYANFESELKTRYTEGEKKSFEDAWAELVEEAKSSLGKDPKSELGIGIAKRVMDLVNGLYGKEHANLKHSVWEKGFKKGQMEGGHFLAPEIVDWLDQAIDAYYRGRIYGLLDQAKPNASSQLAVEWAALLEEMYGDSQILKQELIDAAMTDNRVSDAARKWLKQLK